MAVILVVQCALTRLTADCAFVFDSKINESAVRTGPAPQVLMVLLIADLIDQIVVGGPDLYLQEGSYLIIYAHFRISMAGLFLLITFI